jgi:PadR family transcriptional regulator PadR
VIDREFFLGFIKIHILYHAAKEPVFGVEISKELARHGYYLGPGTLYPTLHRLEKEGYLEQSQRVTEGGKTMLEAASGKIRELVEEVLEDKDRMAGGLKK